MYEKQTWKNGDVITEEKLNHMEDGIANAGDNYLFEITITEHYDESTDTTTYSADKTYSDVHEFLPNGTGINTFCRLIETDSYGNENIDKARVSIFIDETGTGAYAFLSSESDSIELYPVGEETYKHDFNFYLLHMDDSVSYYTSLVSVPVSVFTGQD